MMYVFQSGKLSGKSLEQIAIDDYPKFMWLFKNLEKIPESWKERMKEIDYALNNFESKIKCKCCGKPARLMSVLIYPETRDIAASINFVYCSKECAHNDSESALLEPVYHRYGQLHKIKYSSLLNFDKKFQKTISNIFYKCLIGCIDEKNMPKKTKPYLYSLINNVLKEIEEKQKKEQEEDKLSKIIKTTKTL